MRGIEPVAPLVKAMLKLMGHSLFVGINMGLGGSPPAYTPPPAAPPAAAPPTLASSTVAASAARQRSAMGSAAQDIGTSGGAEGVAPSSVTTGKTTLGGVS